MSKIQVHEDFDYNVVTSAYDIAVLSLENPVIFSNTIRPLCLSMDNTLDLENKNVVLAGFGLTFKYFETIEITNELLETDLTVINMKNCIELQEFYKINYPLLLNNRTYKKESEPMSPFPDPE